jgi:hypothetical protein
VLFFYSKSLRGLAFCVCFNICNGIYTRITLNYLAFQSFDFEHIWWRLFQKRVVCTKLDIYVFIIGQTMQLPKETRWTDGRINTTQKTKDWVTRSSLKNKSSGGVISFCSTSGACSVTSVRLRSVVFYHKCNRHVLILILGKSQSLIFILVDCLISSCYIWSVSFQIICKLLQFYIHHAWQWVFKIDKALDMNISTKILLLTWKRHRIWINSNGLLCKKRMLKIQTDLPLT